MFCAQCGSQVSESDRFCTSCGQPVAPSTAAPARASGGPQFGPAPTPPPPPPPPPPPATWPAPGGAHAAPGYGLPPGYGQPPPPPPGYGQVPAGYAPAPGAGGSDVDPDTGARLAGWGKRVGAYLLDLAVVGIPLGIIWLIVLGASITHTNQIIYNSNGTFSYATVFHPARFWPATIGLEAISWLYFIVLIGRSRGQTVGMMALGIAVRDSTSNVAIGMGRAFVRQVVIFVLGLPLGIPLLVDYLSPLWDRRQQAWHDHAASSIVIAVR